MNRLAFAAIGLSAVAIAVGVASITRIPAELTCVEAFSTGSTDCTDAGNFPGKCAVAKCPAGYTLTGGGGTCAAGASAIKALNPKLSTGEFFIMCEKLASPGSDPRVNAICCKL